MITFLSDKLEFEGMEIGIAATIMLVCSIPGGWAAGRVTKWSEPITSSKFSLFVVIINTATAAAVLTGPERKNYAYIFTGIWGFASAWKFTSDRMLVSLIIPGGQNVEMMGFYLFSGLVLSWVPPLVFTALNEVGVSQRIGLATLDVYYLAGLLCYFLMGSFRAAVENARSSPSDIGSEELPVAI
jgi:MFS-type transporter involved in bile tolerance (Atg22 family)